MNQRLSLALAVAGEHADAVALMARRVTDRIVDVGSCQACVTDDPSLAVETASAGKPTLVLDPFRLSEATRAQLAALPTVPGHTARFVPSIGEVYQTCAAGKLGAAGLLRIHLWQSVADRADELLAEQLDLAIWLFGRQTPETTYTVSRPGYTQVHLGFAPTGMALIDLDTSLPAGNDYYSLSLIGSTGAAYADDHRNMNLVWDADGSRMLPTEEGQVAFRNLLAAFVGAIASHQPSPVTWKETEVALAAAEQIASAAEQPLVVRGRTDG